MKVLLTGGMGYIGSHVAVELIQAGHEVVILDNLSNSKIEVLDKIAKITGVRPEFFEVDICDMGAMEKVFASGGIEAVIHFAGLKAVAESVEEPARYYRVNVGGTVNLLDAMRKYGVRKLVFSSSATVYGNAREDGVYDEEVPAGRGIASPYGETKYVIEQLLKAEAAARPEMEVTILRYFNPVGAHESGLLGEDPNGIPNNLMPVIMRVAEGKLEKLAVYGDDYDTPDGTCMRDYIHVMDLASGHLAALGNLRPGVEVYNLGTGRGTSVLEMVKAFEKASGRELPYTVEERRAGDLPVVLAVPEKAERELGWKAERTIEDAMRDTLKFLELGAA